MSTLPPPAPPKSFDASVVFVDGRLDNYTDVISYGPSAHERYYWIQLVDGVVISWPTETISEIEVAPQGER